MLLYLEKRKKYTVWYWVQRNIALNKMYLFLVKKLLTNYINYNNIYYVLHN